MSARRKSISFSKQPIVLCLNQVFYIIFVGLWFNEHSKKDNDVDGISQENWNLLEKVKSTQRKDHLKGTKFGSPTANDRLMKELRDIFRSDNYKNGK